MSLNSPALFGYGLVTLGAVLAAIGLVQVGLAFIAVGTAGVSLSSKAMSRVERYLPLLLALSLLILAFALPAKR